MTTIVTGERTAPGPPSTEAQHIAQDMDDHSRFVIVRRGPFSILRYDACEYVVHPSVRHPRNLHEAAGRHACLSRVGFGLTRRGALRAMRRCKDYALPWVAA